MSTFPGSPKLVPGAIVGIDPANPLASIIIFQYNPGTITRTITPSAAEGSQNQGEVLRLKGPPKESITVDVEIDAADQLEKDEFPANAMGVHPTLASLEMLLYPKSAVVIANQVLAAAGMIEIVPPEAPLTLFVWGLKRVVPVRIKTLTITEQAFDPALNPIRAKVTLAMDVLTYQDLGLASVGGALFMAHQVIKEAMATINGAGSIGAAATLGVELLGG